MIVDLEADDLMVRAGEVEGRFFEHFLSEPALGLGLSREAFYRVGARIFTLERALQIRNWGRTRTTDETIVPYLTYPEVKPNPFTGERVAANPAKFERLMDEYYDLRGWDRATGWPTRAALEGLGMRDIADDLARNGKIPEEVESQ